MSILKRGDLIAENILGGYRKEIKETIAELKKLQEATRKVNKESTGEAAKERVKLTNDLQKATIRLEKAESSHAVELQKIKVETQQLNKVNKQQATIISKTSGEYQKQSTILNIVRTRYKDLAAAGKQNSKEAKNLMVNITKLDSRLKKIDTTVGQSQRRIGKYGDAMKGIAKQMLLAGGIVGALMAMGRVLKDAMRIYKDFEKANSKLTAILASTKDGIKTLTKQAKLLGSTTAFTATQVLQLQTELAKLGFTMEEIEASTPGILALAAATGSELAPAAELAGATLRIFNLNASEMTRVTDVLALSTSKSSLSMEKLSVIMPIVGKTAQIAGVSLERTAALAGTLTDRGLDASMAATALRNIFLELSKKGLTWNDAMTEINNSTDKNKTAMDLFGKRAAAAGVVLSETADDTERLTTALENAEGAAQRMADTMLDNLSGDITIAKSAWEGFILSIEDGGGVFSNIFRLIIQKATDLLTTFRRLNEGESPFLIGMKDANDFDGKLQDIIGKTDRLIDVQGQQIDQISLGIGKINQQLRASRGDEARQIQLQAQKKVLQEQLVLIKAKNFEEEKGAAITKRSNTLKFRLREILFLIKEEEAKSTNDSKIKAEQLKFQRDFLQGQIEHLNKITPVQNTNNKILEKEVGNTDKIVKNQKKRLTEEQKIEKATRERLRLEREELKQLERNKKSLKGVHVLTPDDKVDISPLQAQIDAETKARADARAKELKRIQDWEDAKVVLAEQAGNSIVQLSSDIFSAYLDDKLHKFNQQAEAEKSVAQTDADAKIAILQDQLDKGLISEEEFAAQSALINENLQSKITAIENQQRLESARAQKKQAIFDVAISTALAIIKTFANLGFPAGIPASLAVAGVGAIQAAAIAAAPLPKYEKGGKVQGKSHTEGGVPIEAEGDEFMVQKKYAPNADNMLNLINDGILTDANYKAANERKDYSLNGLMMENNSLNSKILKLLERGGIPYTINGKGYIDMADGTTKEFNP